MFRSWYHLVAAAALFSAPIIRFWMDPIYHDLAPLVLSPAAIGAILTISKIRGFWKLQGFGAALLVAIFSLGQILRLQSVSSEFLVLLAYASYLPAQLIVFVVASLVLLMPWRYSEK